MKSSNRFFISPLLTLAIIKSCNGNVDLLDNVLMDLLSSAESVTFPKAVYVFDKH